MATRYQDKPPKKSVLFEEEDEAESSSSSSSDEENQKKNDTSKHVKEKLSINRKYAQAFEARKQKEELTKYGRRNLEDIDNNIKNDNDDDSIGTSSSSEDEHAELLTESLDVNILKTINAIRSKDAKIYDPNQRFFQEEDEDDEEKDSEEESREMVNKKKTPKPMRYKDVLREQVLEKMKHEKDDDDDDDDDDGKSIEASDDDDDDDDNYDEDEDGKRKRAVSLKGKSIASRLAYDAQQQELRQAFLESTKDLGNEDDDNDDGNEDDNSDDASRSEEDVVSKTVSSKKKVKKRSDNWLTLKDKRKNAKQQQEPQEQQFTTSREYAEEMRKLELSLANHNNNSNNSNNSSRSTNLVDPKGEVQDGEKFLLEYFKNRTWIDNDDDDDDHDDDELSESNVQASTADVAKTSGKKKIRKDEEGKENGDNEKDTAKDDDSGDDGDAAVDDVSLDELDRADDFEARYNFRFEDALAQSLPSSGADMSLMRYSRGQDMQSATLRRPKETRKEKRQARLERKAAERKAKEEQLKRLKNAKRREMEEKLQKVKAVLGEFNPNTGSRDGGGEASSSSAAVDEAAILKLLEGDFDPDKFEALMKETYGDDFYERPDSEWKSDQDVRKSLREDDDGELLVGQDDEDGGLYDNVAEDEEGNNTADQDEGGYDEEWPEEEDYEEGFQEEENETELEKKVKSKLMDELYKLDYEDIVAGQPTRFKYRKVEPNNFGLSTEEILFARDSTLKQFVSLKKIAPYQEDEHFVGSKKRRRFREMLKHDIEEEMVQTSQPAAAHDNNVDENVDSTELEPKKRKKNRRLKKGKTREDVDDKKQESSGLHEDKRDKNSLQNDGEKKDKLKVADTSPLTIGAASDEPAAREVSSHKEKEKVTDATSNGDGASSNTKKRKRKHKKKTKKNSIEGVSDARLASYGL